VAQEGKVVNVRADDDVHTAILRLKNYHKHDGLELGGLDYNGNPLIIKKV
jgi:hypothetical protein